MRGAFVICKTALGAIFEGGSTTNMSTIKVTNETEASVTRTTKDGRKLVYEMKVLQEPQRARACGSGAKCTSMKSC